MVSWRIETGPARFTLGCRMILQVGVHQLSAAKRQRADYGVLACTLTPCSPCGLAFFVAIWVLYRPESVSEDIQ